MRLPLSLLDLRHVLRGLRRTPVFTIVTLLTLTLAIGANSAVFSLVDQVLLRPLPYPQAERLVAVWADMSAAGFPRKEYTNLADFTDWRTQSRGIADMAAYGETRPALTGFGIARQLRGGTVTHSFFDVLWTRMQLGRGFEAAEDVPNGPDVAVISHAFWQNELGGAPNVLERSLTLDGEPYAIVGVLPPGFAFPFMPDREVWRLLQATPDDRGNAYMRVVGRLAPEATLGQAAADMSTIGARLAGEFPDTNSDVGVYVQPLADAVADAARPRLLVLWAAVGFVLLVACLNISNLLLVRAAARTRELAVRGALGARRGSLAVLVVSESVLLSLGGGLLGLAFAELAVNLLHAELPADAAAVVSPDLDPRVLAVTLLGALAAGVLFGLLPALRAGGADPAGALRGGTTGLGPLATRNVLVVANLALALALTTGAALFGRSLLRLEAVDPGFEAGGVLTATLTLPGTSYADPDARRAFQAALLDRLRALPGVREAGFTHTLPLGDTNTDTSVFIEGRPTPRRDGRAHVWYSVVTPGYLEAMRIRAREGRSFTDQDQSGNAPVVLVNEAFVRQYLGGERAVGRRVTPGDPSEGNWMTIVGVVDDVRYFSIDERQTPAAYLPMHRYPQGRFFIVLDTASDPALLAGPLRDAVASLDPELALDDVQPMSALVDASLRPARSMTVLVGAFAGAALLIAVIGVYGAIAYSVVQRRREFGVRMALGADRPRVLALVLRQGLRLALAGVLLGLALAAGLGRGLRSLLYEIDPLDPLVLGGVALLLLAVALAATALPAWRAARTQPMRVLREE